MSRPKVLFLGVLQIRGFTTRTPKRGLQERKVAEKPLEQSGRPVLEGHGTSQGSPALRPRPLLFLPGAGAARRWWWPRVHPWLPWRSSVWGGLWLPVRCTKGHATGQLPVPAPALRDTKSCL